MERTCQNREADRLVDPLHPWDAWLGVGGGRIRCILVVLSFPAPALLNRKRGSLDVEGTSVFTC